MFFPLCRDLIYVLLFFCQKRLVDSLSLLVGSVFAFNFYLLTSKINQ